MKSVHKYLTERLSSVVATAYNNDPTKISDFIQASMQGQLDKVKIFLEKENIDPNATNSWGHTALGNAIANDQIEVITYLLNNGSDVSKVNNGDIDHIFNTNTIGLIGKKVKEEELYNACSGWIKIPEKSAVLWDSFQYLTKKHINELMYRASMENRIDVVRVLLEEYGASVNHLSGFSGWSPLATALKHNHIDMAKYLLSQGADISQPMQNNKQPFDYASKSAKEALKIEERVSSVKPTEKRKVNKQELKDMITEGQSIDDVDYSHITDMTDMFADYIWEFTIPDNFDTSNVTVMEGMFLGCAELTTIPKLDTSKVTDMRHMFNRCNKLEKVPQLDTSKVTDMDYMFVHCYALKTIPELNTSNVQTMQAMFQGCESLEVIPKLDTSACKNMVDVFRYCPKLKTIGRPSDWYEYDWRGLESPMHLLNVYPELFDEAIR